MTDTQPADSSGFTPPPLQPTNGRYACTGTPMWMCTDCGAAIDYIWGRALHDQFHAKLALDGRAIARAIEDAARLRARP